MYKPVRAALTAVQVLTGAFAASVAAYMPFVIADAKRDYNDDCEYLMILGGDIYGADTPSPQLRERMKKAAVYLNEHKEVVAVPCGGCFRKEQKRSEAEIIASYLIENGISPERIVLEDKSTTTFENFEFALKIIEAHSGKKINALKIAFLSSSYHMHRAGIMAKMNGIKDVRRVSAPTPGDAFQRYMREYFVAYELLLRKTGIKK